MNPCPCGYYGDPVKPCTCSPGMVTKYQKRISGPLLDRIDIHISVPRVEYDKLSDARLGEPSAVVRARVEAARERQRQRFAGGITEGVLCNADMRPAEVRKFCQLDETGQHLMKTAMIQIAAFGAGLPPRAQAGAHHRRPGGGGADCPGAPGGGASIQAEGGYDLRRFFDLVGRCSIDRLMHI